MFRRLKSTFEPPKDESEQETQDRQGDQPCDVVCPTSDPQPGLPSGEDRELLDQVSQFLGVKGMTAFANPQVDVPQFQARRTSAAAPAERNPAIGTDFQLLQSQATAVRAPSASGTGGQTSVDRPTAARAFDQGLYSHRVSSDEVAVRRSPGFVVLVGSSARRLKLG